MKLKKPQPLLPGDKVAAISLSWGGPGQIPHRYEAGKLQLEKEFGLKVVESRHALRDPAWIYRNPKARADDLLECFSDISIKGIISTIGGDDSIRILPHLDLYVIRENPKIFLGYSDSTITHTACSRAGLSSFYGPSVMAGFAENGGMFRYMVDSVRRTLFSKEVIGQVSPNTQGWTVEHLDWGPPENQSKKRRLNPAIPWRFIQGEKPVTGHLFGGCTDVLEFLKGTEFWPEKEFWKGAIFFLENSEDAPSPAQFKYWLRNYGMLGIFNLISGILFARPGGGIEPKKFAEYDQVLLDVVGEEFGRKDIPIVTQMDFGHTDPMFVIPYGASVRVDPLTQKFEILEAGCS